MTTELAPVEAQALTEHEAVIERGLNTFTEVGNALLAIRDRRLYRQTHETFEDYCQERWGFGRDYADRMITAALVVPTIVGSGLPAPANEGQARELARIPEPQRAEVWQATLERTDGKPTAAAIRETYAPRPAGQGAERADSAEPDPPPVQQNQPDSHLVAPSPLPPPRAVHDAGVEQQAADFARLDAELNAEMENTETRFRRNFSAAAVRAGEITNFDPDRIAEVFTGNWDRDIGDLLDSLTAWCENVADARRRYQRAGLRIVGGAL